MRTEVYSDSQTSEKTGSLALISFPFLLLVWLMISSCDAYALKYFAKTSGEWTDVNTWCTDTCGDALNKGTFPQAGDDVYICDGVIVTVSSDVACDNLTVGGGNSGILQFGFTKAVHLTINGTLVINKGGILQYNYNANKIHTILLFGDFVNNGNVSLRFDRDDYVSIVVRGPEKTTISGKGNWGSLAYMVMDKQNKDVKVTISSIGFGQALTAGAATLKTPKPVGKNPPVIFICGTFIYNIPDELSNLINPGAAGDPSLTINPNVTIQVEQGTVDLGTFPGIGSMGNCILEGTLIVNGGTVTISKNTASSWNVGLYYCSIADYTPSLIIHGGEIICYGAFTSLTSNSDDIDFVMTGGTFKVNCGPIPTDMETFWISDHPGSSVEFTGGTIEIQNKSTHAASTTFSDFDIGGQNIGYFNVSGRATVQFGNTQTKGNQIMRFSAYPNVVYPHFVQFKPVEGAQVKVIPFNASEYRVLSLNEGK